MSGGKKEQYDDLEFGSVSIFRLQLESLNKCSDITLILNIGVRESGQSLLNRFSSSLLELFLVSVASNEVGKVLVDGRTGFVRILAHQEGEVSLCMVFGDPGPSVRLEVRSSHSSLVL